jgi:hypothetical protein
VTILTVLAGGGEELVPTKGHKRGFLSVLLLRNHTTGGF